MANEEDSIKQDLNNKTGVNCFGKGYTGGPKGFGDPNDFSLRHVEDYIYVTQIVKNRANLEKCHDLVQKWGECMETAGYGSFITCKKQIDSMNDCLRYWYSNKEFRKECQEIYLEKRKRFRETGIIQKDPKVAYYVSSKKQQSNITQLNNEANSKNLPKTEA